jgi:hypothetical protein
MKQAQSGSQVRPAQIWDSTNIIQYGRHLYTLDSSFGFL